MAKNNKSRALFQKLWRDVVFWKKRRARMQKDITAPTVVISSSESSPSPALPVPIAFTLSEISTDFIVGSLTLAGCTVANFGGSGISYTCEATPTTPNGTFTIDVAANVFHDASNNGNIAATQFSFTSSAFDLADEFTDTVAPGAVNGTTATPTGQTRTATDTNSKLSIGSGVADFATGGAAAGNPGLWYPGRARAAGKALIARLAGTNTNYSVGWDSNAAGGVSQALNFFTTGVVRAFLYAIVPLTVGANPASGATVYGLILLRNTGAFFFIKEATAFPKWRLLYPDKNGADATVYPSLGAQGITAVFTSGFIRIPQNLIIVSPLASDAFTRANGALGNTGGGGSEESGGSGLAWVNQVGTVEISGNKAMATSLSVDRAICTVPVGAESILLEAAVTRGTTGVGLVMQYVDADNYVYVRRTAANVQLINRVGGVETTAITGTPAEVNGSRLMSAITDITTEIVVRTYYNEALVGGEQYLSNFGGHGTSGDKMGLIFFDLDSSIDNFVCWARGVDSEYEEAFNKYAV